MNFELSTPTKTILDEIANKALHQADVSKTIALVFLSGQREQVDWKLVNSAIVTRWSQSARERVLSMAWKIAEETHQKMITRGGFSELEAK